MRTFIISLTLFLLTTNLVSSSREIGAEEGAEKTADAVTNKKTPSFMESIKTITDTIAKTKQETDALQDTLTTALKNQGPLISQDMMQAIVKEHSKKPLKAGSHSISMRTEQGFNGFSKYQPPGWRITETVDPPTDKSFPPADGKSPVYTYPDGVGPVLINNCMDANYSMDDPCYARRHLGQGRVACPNLMEATGYIGVGFDGRGFYKIESRKASLVQRTCANAATFMGKDVPDNMNVFSIFETIAETRSFQSVDEYMAYIRKRAGLSKQKNLFLSEASQYSRASSHGFNMGAIDAAAGGVIGAMAGGPMGASAEASLHSSIGLPTGEGLGRGSEKSEKASSRESESAEYKHSENSNGRHPTFNHYFATMYINIILYEISLDNMKPENLNVKALRDFMDLPASYYSIGSAVKYQNFLVRWGTHFIRSAKFGGQLKITKTAKVNKIMSVEEFASIAENEFQSMFASLQSKYVQKSSGFSLSGFGTKSSSTTRSSHGKRKSKHTSTANSHNQMSKSFQHSEFTKTIVEAQGGTPQIAEALADFYTPSFKQTYHDWIASVKNYIKPFEFQLGPIDQIFNVNKKDLFPAGKFDFSCDTGADGTEEILIDPNSNRRYYIEKRVTIINNKKVETKRKVPCKYDSYEDFENAIRKRRVSLQTAVAVYMAEGPFPTSSDELEAGQPGCEERLLAQMTLFGKDAQPLTYAQLSKEPFLISFDLPRELPHLVKREAKYIVSYRTDRWFAIDPRDKLLHLYEGCQLTGYLANDTKICFKNIILTYEEKNGYFRVEPADFAASHHQIPTLPRWLSGSTVARALPLQASLDEGDKYKRPAVPCNVKWLNSHRLDPNKNVNCLHFTAASEGDIFVIFSSVPRDKKTWYYLQIYKEGVAYYQAMQLKKRDVLRGVGILGDSNLYQSFFVCLIQINGAVTIEYGRADADSDVGTVYSAYKFLPASKYSQLAFYSFSAGSKAASLMNIHLTNEMPDANCLVKDYVRKGKNCSLDCHSECIKCELAQDDKACRKCRHVRVEMENAADSNGTKIIKCLNECPAGYQLNNTSDNLCVKCQIGTAKSKPGNHKCFPCPQGSFSSKIGGLNCIQCHPGMFSNETGSVRCQGCPAGTAVKARGSTECRKCAPGTLSGTGHSECVPCPKGQFSSSGQSICKPCSVGYFSEKLGQHTCAPCPAGKSSPEGSGTCTNCTKGEFNPSRGMTCRKCPPGMYSDSTGSISCSACQRGSFQPKFGQDACISASAGYYTVGLEASNQKLCPVGSANAKTGQDSQSACVPCSAGSYSNITGSATCVPCPKGSYQPSVGQTVCLDVSPGSYAGAEGLAKQTTCPPGKFSGASATECAKCAAGSYSDQKGSTGCKNCPVKQWSSAGAAACTEYNDSRFTHRIALMCLKSEFIKLIPTLEIMDPRNCAEQCFRDNNCQAFRFEMRGNVFKCEQFVFTKCSHNILRANCTERSWMFVRNHEGLTPGMLCPSGYSYGLGGSVYKLYDSADWHRGKSVCKAERGLTKYADVDDVREAKHMHWLLKNKFDNKSFFIGGKMVAPSTWEWISCKKPITNDLWASSEPDDMDKGAHYLVTFSAYTYGIGTTVAVQKSFVKSLCECVDPFV